MSDDELVPALSSLVSGAPVPITLRVSPIQVHPDLETTAYYVAAEALTNAVKHARAQRITLEVDEIDGDLLVRVSDDGIGRFRAPHAGPGCIAWPTGSAPTVAVSLSATLPVEAPSWKQRCRAHRHSRGLSPVPRRAGEPAHRCRPTTSWHGCPMPSRCSPASTNNDRTWQSSTSGCLRTAPTTAPAPRRSCASAYPDLGIVLLSQHIETSHSVHLVSGGRFGYLLKDRVLDVDDFLDALRRVAAGGSALDPEVVARPIGVRTRDTGLDALTSRERDVLALMAEGRSNAAIARRLWLSARTVETHVTNVMLKLHLETSDQDHRRVLAVP